MLRAIGYEEFVLRLWDYARPGGMTFKRGTFLSSLARILGFGNYFPL